MENIDSADNVEQIPENACTRYSQCENTIPGDGEMCPDCLDEAREAQRNNQELDWDL